jgi:F-type H+-transporting ATPase subunit b
MQIDWTTFLLEILNFLVLVWLLKRFFYRPVLAVLDKRRAQVKEETDAASRMKQEAEALRVQFEARMKEWNQERERLKSAVDDELAKERERQRSEMKRALTEESEGMRAREQSEGAARKAAVKRQVEATVYAEAAAMLKRLASPALTESIAHLLLEDLGSLSGGELTQLRDAAEHLNEGAAEIMSAHPMPEPQRKTLAAALARAAGRTVSCGFGEDPQLIAGLRITVGECVLHANLADEMAFFRRRGKHD